MGHGDEPDAGPCQPLMSVGVDWGYRLHQVRGCWQGRPNP